MSWQIIMGAFGSETRMICTSWKLLTRLPLRYISFIDGHRDSLSFQMHLWGEIYHLYEALFYFLLKVISTVICFRTTKIQAADFSNFFLQLRVYVHWRSLEEKVTNNNRCQNFSPFNHSDSFFHSVIHSFIHSFIHLFKKHNGHLRIR